MSLSLNKGIRKRLVILVVGLSLSGVAFSQDCMPCLPNGITFTTQNQIDSFPINHPGCTEIGGNVLINGQNEIFNLDGLSGVTSISGDLNINNNYALTGLTGFQNLVSIDGNLIIGGNPRLKTLMGLHNIDPESIKDLYIIGNDSLSECAIESICDYFWYPIGEFEIYGNAAGCNSYEELLNACDTLSITEESIPFKITIFPNPASTQITIETHDQGQLTILNLQGQELLNQQISEPKTRVDISTLPSGVYLVKLTGEQQVQVGKFVKQ